MKQKRLNKDNLKGRQSVFLFLFLTFMTCSIPACLTHKPKTVLHNKTPDQKSKEGNSIITSEIVVKNFVTKNGRKTDRREHYLRRSIQDYFIKFCESEVDESEIEIYLKSKKNDFIKMISVEVEFKNGPLDDCAGDLDTQSRMGEYIVLKRIL